MQVVGHTIHVEGLMVERVSHQRTIVCNVIFEHAGERISLRLEDGAPAAVGIQQPHDGRHRRVDGNQRIGVFGFLGFRSARGSFRCLAAHGLPDGMLLLVFSHLLVIGRREFSPVGIEQVGEDFQFPFFRGRRPVDDGIDAGIDHQSAVQAVDVFRHEGRDEGQKADNHLVGILGVGVAFQDSREYTELVRVVDFVGKGRC